ncbi:hypothetical protein SD436_08645 [Streptococcus sp. 2A/TPW/M5]
MKELLEKLENLPSILNIEYELFLLIDYKRYLLMKLVKTRKKYNEFTL